MMAFMRSSCATAPSSEAEALLANEGRALFDSVALRELALDPAAYGRRLTVMLFNDPLVRLAWVKARGDARGAAAPLRVRLALDPLTPR
jgi:hypothetical protein